MVQIQPLIPHFTDLWVEYGSYGLQRPVYPNMVRVRRQVPVERSNAKLVPLTHPKHFTMGAILAN